MSRTTATFCQRCGRPLTNPASVQLGYGPICAKKIGLPIRFSDPKFRGMYDTSCVCPFCGGKIEIVQHNPFAWTWTCGGVTGDGCQSDYGSNTPAPLKVKRSELRYYEKHKPERFEDARYERQFFFKVFKLTGRLPPYDSLVPKYPQNMDELIAEYGETGKIPELPKFKQFEDMTNEKFEKLILDWIEDQRFQSILQDVKAELSRVKKDEQTVLSA